MTRGEDQSDLGGLDRSDMNWVEDEMAQAESSDTTSRSSTRRGESSFRTNGRFNTVSKVRLLSSLRQYTPVGFRVA